MGAVAGLHTRMPRACAPDTGDSGVQSKGDPSTSPGSLPLSNGNSRGLGWIHFGGAGVAPRSLVGVKCSGRVGWGGLGSGEPRRPVETDALRRLRLPPGGESGKATSNPALEGYFPKCRVPAGQLSTSPGSRGPGRSDSGLALAEKEGWLIAEPTEGLL